MISITNSLFYLYPNILIFSYKKDDKTFEESVLKVQMSKKTNSKLQVAAIALEFGIYFWNLEFAPIRGLESIF